MKENKLVELSMDFSVDIINLVKYLKANHETIISNQIGRSGTSIGANIHEAQYAQGKKDIQTGIFKLYFTQIQVSIDEKNSASIKLFEKSGFECIGKDEELLEYAYVVK